VAEGDVALLPVQAQADHFLAVVLPLADDPGIRHRAGVGAGQRAGKGEAGDVFTACQARQVMVALFFGAVVQQQLGRAEGVGHHHGGGQVTAAGGQFHRHLRVGVGGKALAAVFLGNDQCEEAVLLDVLPGFLRQVHLLADLPVADHCAQLFGRSIDKGLFLLCQLGLGVGQQLVPVRFAAEQLAIPPHRAGLDGIALGGGHRRQYALEPGEQRAGEQLPAQITEQDEGGYRACDDPQQQLQPAGYRAEQGHGHQIGRGDAEGGACGGTTMGQVDDPEQQHQQPDDEHVHSSMIQAGDAPSIVINGDRGGELGRIVVNVAQSAGLDWGEFKESPSCKPVYAPAASLTVTIHW
jgi:hypothetical protein